MGYCVVCRENMYDLNDSTVWRVNYTYDGSGELVENEVKGCSREYPTWLCADCAVFHPRAEVKRANENKSGLCVEESHLCYYCKGYFCTRHKHSLSDRKVEPAKGQDGKCVKVNRYTVCVDCVHKC